jgi:TolB-like protein/DNA-binding winged helix-turn-helix (wHTH) protein
MPQIHRFDRIEVRPAERAVLIDGAPADLGSRAFDVLLELIRHRDRVMTKDELLEAVWPGLVVEENNLQAQVSALRKILGQKAIATIPGRGYQFTLAETPVSEVAPAAAMPIVNHPPVFSEIADSHGGVATAKVAAPILTQAERAAVLGGHPDLAVDAGESPPPPPLSGTSHAAASPAAGRPQGLLSRNRIAAFAAAAGISLIAVVTYWKTGPNEKDTADRPAAIEASGGAKIPGLSIVVLPFTNNTGDPNQEYLADGLTASMTADLARIREASIVDARTAYAYKNKSITAQQVGKELGAKFVLQGNVQRSGNTIRINAQLASATTNAQLWSESFEGDQSNLFALFDQVTGRLSKTIGEQIYVVAGRESETRKSNPKAADLIFRAQAEYIKPPALENMQLGDRYFRQALALEPGNVSAKLGIALSTNMLIGNYPSNYDAAARQKLLAEARAFALDVKKIDPDDFRIYTILGWLEIEADNFEAARPAFEKVVALDPKDSTGILTLANFHFYAGEPERTIEFVNRAMSIPGAGKFGSENFSHYLLCCAHFMLGEWEKSIAECKKSIAVHEVFAPSRAYLALAYSKNGDDVRAAEAVAAMRKLPAAEQLDPLFEVPKPVQTAAYRKWYETSFKPTAERVGLWGKNKK